MAGFGPAKVGSCRGRFPIVYVSDSVLGRLSLMVLFESKLELAATNAKSCYFGA